MSSSTGEEIYYRLIPALAKFKRGEGTFDDVIKAAWRAKKGVDFTVADLDLDEDCKTLGWASACPGCRYLVYKGWRHDGEDCLETKHCNLRDFIRELACAPETQLDIAFSGKCVDFQDGDPVRFLRDLRDMCVFAGASSDFVVMAISAVLDSNEFGQEDPEEAEKRRSDLEQRWNGP